MNPDDELKSNGVPKSLEGDATSGGFSPDVIPVPGGTKIKSGQLDLANVRMRYVSQEEYGTDGLLIEPIPGSGLFEFLISSAGFFSPGGNFYGTVTIRKDDASIVLTHETSLDELIIQPHPEGAGIATLELDNQPAPGTGTPAANRTIKIWINGTAYYLLASTIP